jgi:16S rRNA (guanine966-N2)-methyltransferase
VRQNIAAVCKSLGRSMADLLVLQADARSVPTGGAEALPDLVFIDPPYDVIEDVASVLFERLAELLRSNAEAIVVFEYPGEITLSPNGWTLLKRLGKGARQPTVGFFRQAALVPS